MLCLNTLTRGQHPFGPNPEMGDHSDSAAGRRALWAIALPVKGKARLFHGLSRIFAMAAATLSISAKPSTDDRLPLA